MLTAVGLAFLLDNLDLVESWTILRFWPVILLVVGLRNLVDARDRGSAVGGTLLAAAGALLLLNSLNLIDVDLWDLWPLVLVAVGIRALINVLSDSKGLSEVLRVGGRSASAFLGAVERRNRSADFRGGSASAFMGGVDLDLREADIAADRAVIHVSRDDGRRRHPACPRTGRSRWGWTSLMGGGGGQDARARGGGQAAGAEGDRDHGGDRDP